jgi:arylsulfatase A-like enzyme
MGSNAIQAAAGIMVSNYTDTEYLMDRLWPRMRIGISEGIQVFLCYAAAEYVFLAISLAVRPHRVMLLPQWRGTVVLFAAYILLGILAGAVAGGVLAGPVPNRERIRKALILTILAAFTLNTATAGLSAPNRAALVSAAAMLMIGVFFDVGSRYTGLGLAKEPALVFGALVASGWSLLNTPIAALRPAFRVTAAPILMITFVAGALLAQRLLVWAKNRHSGVAILEHAFNIAAILVLCCSPIVISSRAEGKDPVWLPPTSGSGSPNVLLITLDTVSADHMGIYGYARANTPNLSALAAQSTVYSNFIAVAPLTLTSHASMFTGLYPQSHGAYKEFNRFTAGRPLDARIPTMAQILANRGYRTMAVVANRYYLNAEFGTLRGFQFVDWMAPTVLVAPERDYLLRSRLRNLLRFDPVVRDFDNVTISAAEVNRRAAYLLDRASHQTKPFFLFLNYCDAHMPYLPPAPYNALYPGRDLGFDLKEYTQTMEAVNNRNTPLSPASRAHLVSQYDGAIAYLDAELGRIIGRLKQDGDFDRTMIIITSDHGEAFGDRNIVFHDAAVYQDEVHIPLLIKYPGQTSGARVDTLASHVDLMPTVMNVLGIQPPAAMQGVDLRNMPAAPRVVVSEMHASTNYDGPRFQQIEYAVYSWPYKMIYSTNGMRELYDLSADPFEHRNLFRLEAPLTSDLRTKLVNWSFSTTPRYLDAGPANRDVVERLKSLGYAHQGVD